MFLTIMDYHEELSRSSSLSSAEGRETSEDCSLSNRINTATRLLHTQLNRLIIARLPLALPPNAPDPSTYLAGLLHIAPIYITFELLWGKRRSRPGHLAAPNRKSSLSNGLENYSDEDFDHSEHQVEVSSRINAILSNLQLPGLLRSQRLRSDIKTISGKSNLEIEEQLQHISSNGQLSEFVKHIDKSVRKNPHVLMAYAWVLYMALFSGGRYMRASLERAGTDFWTKSRGGESSASQSTKKSSDYGKSRITTGLQFFHFIGEEDGEDIKRDFKKRFAQAETILTDGEKKDIIREAEYIFTFLGGIVGQLDEICSAEDLGKNSTEKKNVQRARGVVAIRKLDKKLFNSGKIVAASIISVLVLVVLLSSPKLP